MIIGPVDIATSPEMDALFEKSLAEARRIGPEELQRRIDALNQDTEALAAHGRRLAQYRRNRIAAEAWVAAA